MEVIVTVCVAVNVAVRSKSPGYGRVSVGVFMDVIVTVCVAVYVAVLVKRPGRLGVMYRCALQWSMRVGRCNLYWYLMETPGCRARAARVRRCIYCSICSCGVPVRVNVLLPPQSQYIVAVFNGVLFP